MNHMRSLVAVPTPADRHHRPDLSPSIAALRMTGTAMDTTEVPDATATKWNTIHLSPGRVSGFGEGVDPYDRVLCSTIAGHNYDAVLRAHEINDWWACHASNLMLSEMIARGLTSSDRQVL